MSEKISVTLSPDRLQVGPGESVETTITIKNASDVVEAYSIVIEGIDPEWCTLSVSSLSLFPGDQEQVRLTIQPPKTTAGKAGTYNVIIKVASRRDATIESTAQLAVEVGRFLLFDLDLSPKKARGRKGSYRVIITNSGNVPTTYTLSGEDAEDMCRFEFKSQAAKVEPGATAEVPLVINPKKKPFTGRAKAYGFKITVTPHASEAGEGKSVEGQLECKPLIPAWALGVGGLAVGAIITVVVVLVMGGGGGAPGPTPDTEAPTVSITHSPSNPQGCVQVQYVATAASPSGINRIQIYIDSVMVKECAGSSCSYTDGPYYLQREVNYEARAWDMENNEGTSGLKVYEVISPCVP
jgi:hypothetical protein